MKESPPKSPRATKRCSKCEEVKPRAEWGEAKGRYDGLQVYCKACMNIARVESSLRKVVDFEGLGAHNAMKAKADELRLNEQALIEYMTEVEAEAAETARKLVAAMGSIDRLRARLAQLESRAPHQAGEVPFSPPHSLEGAFNEARAKLVDAGHLTPAASLREILALVEEYLPMDAAVRRDMILHLADIYIAPEPEGTYMGVTAHVNHWGVPVWKAIRTPHKYRVIYELEGTTVKVRELMLRKEVYRQRGRN